MGIEPYRRTRIQIGNSAQQHGVRRGQLEDNNRVCADKILDYSLRLDGSPGICKHLSLELFKTHMVEVLIVSGTLFDSCQTSKSWRLRSSKNVASTRTYGAGTTNNREILNRERGNATWRLSQDRFFRFLYDNGRPVASDLAFF